MSTSVTTAWAAARVLKASSGFRLARFYFRVSLVLACLALPWQAAAQSGDIMLSISVDGADRVEEGGQIFFLISASRAPLTQDIPLDITFQSITADVDSDLGAKITSTWLYDNAVGTGFNVQINDDRLLESDETFSVTISSANLPDGVKIANASATGTIIDNDTLTTVSIEDTTVVEGDGDANFIIRLSQPLDAAFGLSLNYTPITAGLGSDIATTARKTTAYIPRNATRVIFPVPIVDDQTVESSETFMVTITDHNYPGVVIGDNTATGRITDNDTATVNIEDVSVTEDSRNASFMVTLSNPVSSAVALDIDFAAGTADLEADLGTLPTKVNIPANSTGSSFTVPINNDELVEGEETFTATVSLNSALERVTVAEGVATGRITDTDAATVSIDDVRVAENRGNASFKVTLSKAVSSPVTLDIDYTAGTADLETDLGTLPSELIIPAHSTTASLNVPINNDEIVESEETFTATITVNPSLERVTVAEGVATATIISNDMALVSLRPATLEAAEGATFTYTVDLSTAVDEAVNINWSAAGAGATVDDDDLAPRTGSVTFPAGTTTAQTITITAIDDDKDEDNETFTVTITAADAMIAGWAIDKNNNSSMSTIIDNDEAPEEPQEPEEVVVNVMVNIEDAEPVAEDAGAARFAVSLSEAVADDVVLGVTYAAGSADLADLGNPRPATVTVTAGATGATLDVPIFDDTIIEDAETFTVILAVNTAPERVVADGAVATGTIARTAELSTFIESRLSGAGAALRRHTSRFESMTSAVVQNRLDGRRTQHLGNSEGNGAVAVGGGFGKTDATGTTSETEELPWGVWLDAAWSGFDGTASGRQADVYSGVDYLGDGWLIGALIGYEMADLDIGEVTYSADYTHVGVYGGARLSAGLVFDGAATYGTATPDLGLGDVSASYDAHRFTVRAGVTGDFGLEYGLQNGSVTIVPQLGVLYAREQLDGFTDSVGGEAGSDMLKLGRFSAGPRLTWDFEGGQVTGGVRLLWDFLQLDDGVDGRRSGAADIGLRLDLTPNASLGVLADVEGLGISNDFTSFGARVELDVRF